MSRLNLDDSGLEDPLLNKGVKGDVHIETLTGAKTVDRDMRHILPFDPRGASRMVTHLANEKGLWWIIVNGADAAEYHPINDPAATTRGTISQNEIAIAVMDSVRSYLGTL